MFVLYDPSELNSWFLYSELFYASNAIFHCCSLSNGGRRGITPALGKRQLRGNTTSPPSTTGQAEPPQAFSYNFSFLVAALGAFLFVFFAGLLA